MTRKWPNRPAYCERCQRIFVNKSTCAAHSRRAGCVDVLRAADWHAVEHLGLAYWTHGPHPRLPRGEDDVDPSRCPPWIAG